MLHPAALALLVAAPVRAEAPACLSLPASVHWGEAAVVDERTDELDAALRCVRETLANPEAPLSEELAARIHLLLAAEASRTDRALACLHQEAARRAAGSSWDGARIVVSDCPERPPDGQHPAVLPNLWGRPSVDGHVGRFLPDTSLPSLVQVVDNQGNVRNGWSLPPGGRPPLAARQSTWLLSVAVPGTVASAGLVTWALDARRSFDEVVTPYRSEGGTAVNPDDRETLERLRTTNHVAGAAGITVGALAAAAWTWWGISCVF